VDSQGAIAKRYQISAMPTFILIKDGEVIKTVKGANPTALKVLVAHASKTVKQQKQESGEDILIDEELDNASGDLDALPNADGTTDM
jgi:thioredoxin-like negative regulator of GroEL